jgi:hypothetical protein
MRRRTFDEQLAGLPAGVRRTFDRFDAYAQSRSGVSVSKLFEGRSYKIHGRLLARVDPKANSGNGYLGIQFALDAEALHRRIIGEPRRFVQNRPRRSGGGHPWIFARGESPVLDRWLAETFDIAYETVSLDKVTVFR